MKRLSIYIVLILSALGCGEKSHSHGEHQEKEKTYTCPMHPEIIQSEPGQCPICGMKLVEKIETGEKLQIDSLEILFKPTNEAVLSRVKTIFPKQKEMHSEIDLSGVITYDTKQISTISSRVSGRIDKLFVKYRYQPVTKGQKLMEIHSNELVTEQENFIYLLKNDSENKSLIMAAENRLLLLGITKEQLEELRENKKVFQSLAVFSPYSGHLQDLPEQNSTSMSMITSNTKDMTIKEGMYVQKGQTVFNIYSTEKVWAVLNIFSDEQNEIKIGSKVILSVNGIEEHIEGIIDFVEPVVREGLQTISARIFIDNKTRNIKIGSLIKAKALSENRKGLFIPASSISHLGSSDVVFIKEGTLFSVKEVKRGKSRGNEVEVLSGLTESDEIALNGQMLIDSESFTRINK